MKYGKVKREYIQYKKGTNTAYDDRRSKGWRRHEGDKESPMFAYDGIYPFLVMVQITRDMPEMEIYGVPS